MMTPLVGRPPVRSRGSLRRSGFRLAHLSLLAGPGIFVILGRTAAGLDVACSATNLQISKRGGASFNDILTNSNHGLPKVPLRAEPVTVATVAASLGSAVAQIAQSGAYDSLKKGFANMNRQELTKLKKSEVRAHVEKLTDDLINKRCYVCNLAPNLPQFSVKHTKFELLMADIFRDRHLKGSVSVFAELGAGKSVATALAITDRAKQNVPGEIQVLLYGDFDVAMKEFLKVPEAAWVSYITQALFQELHAKGWRLVLVLDHMFDKPLEPEQQQIFLQMTRAAFDLDHCICVVCQDKAIAQTVANLGGERTKLAPQQLRRRLWWRQPVKATSYRWSRKDATLFVKLKQVESRLRNGELGDPGDLSKAELARLIDETSQGCELDRILDATKQFDRAGGWTPVGLWDVSHMYT